MWNVNRMLPERDDDECLRRCRQLRHAVVSYLVLNFRRLWRQSRTVSHMPAFSLRDRMLEELPA